MDLKYWNVALSHVSDVSDWLPFLAFILLSTDKRKEFKMLGAYLLLMGFLKTATYLLILVKGRVNTMWFYHLMAIVEVIGLYFYMVPSLSLKKPLVYGLISAIVLLNLLSSIFLQKIDKFNSNAWSINTIVLISVAI